ncbi:hypothetical protein Dimus_017286 [Dionaea muscipula]
MDKAGRRVLLLVSTTGMTASLLLVSIAFYVESSADNLHLHGMVAVLSLVGLLGMIITFSLGVGPIPWLIMSEILPVNIKGLAGSLATLANFLTSWGVTMTANLLFSWSRGGTFTIYTSFCALMLVFVALWLPETKGRTLEEIQSSF